MVGCAGWDLGPAPFLKTKKDYYMLLEAAEIFESFGGELRKEYRGRGMNNPTCGIIFENESEFYKTLAELIIDTDEQDRQVISKALRRLQSDSMGLGLIFY